MKKTGDTVLNPTLFAPVGLMGFYIADKEGEIALIRADEAIADFHGKYSFLSNFYESPLVYDGLVFGSVEAAFQAQKCADPRERSRFTRLNPSEAKKMGRHVHLRSDWEDVKDDIMSTLVYLKFVSSPELLKKLQATGDTLLVEGTNWKDNYWGVDKNCTEPTGLNHLGQILEYVRAKLADFILPDGAPVKNLMEM